MNIYICIQYIYIYTIYIISIPHILLYHIQVDSLYVLYISPWMRSWILGNHQFYSRKNMVWELPETIHYCRCCRVFEGESSWSIRRDYKIYIHIYMYIYIYVYIHICIYTYMYIYIYVCTNMKVIRTSVRESLFQSLINQVAWSRHGREVWSHLYCWKCDWRIHDTPGSEEGIRVVSHKQRRRMKR